MSDTAKLLLEANGLSARYPASKADVIADISFRLHEGERLCVIGPNGCGKTTLLRVLAGSLPYTGSLSCLVRGTEAGRGAGEPAERLVERRTLTARQGARETGYLAQLSSAYFSYTVRETVSLGRYARQKATFLPGISREDAEAVDTSMRAAGIEGLAETGIGFLSGGQLQRVFYARALAQDPAVLLLDEPTNHLDLFHQFDLIARLREWVDSPRRASVGVFHDLNLAFAYATRVILMDAGRIAAEGPPETVLRGETINRVYRMDVAASMRALLQRW